MRICVSLLQRDNCQVHTGSLVTTYCTILETKRKIMKSNRITMIFLQAAGSSLSSTLESVIVAVVQVVATILAALVMDKLGESTL